MANASGGQDSQISRHIRFVFNRTWGALALGALFALPTACAISASEPGAHEPVPATVDILISGGTVFVGYEGELGSVADVGVIKDRIVFVGDGAAITARKRIDATGLIVSPGFIDPHTHAGEDLLSDDPKKRLNANYLTQGVTTVFVGNDGGGPSTIDFQRQRAQELGVGTNVAFLVGLGAVRSDVIGMEDRPPSGAELNAMKNHVARAMCQGAFGFSAGLYYTPQNFATTDEVVALAAEAAKRGGYYDTHLRDESSYSIGLFNAVREALEIGRRSGAPTHISHIKALGADVWGQSSNVIALIESARAAGQSVTADQYPWLASGTKISDALLPAWALDGGLDDARKRLSDFSLRNKLQSEIAENLRRRGGANKILITRIIGGPASYNGKTLAEVAELRSETATDSAVSILRTGDAQIASFNMSDADVEQFMAQPWVMTGSDGSSGHPRKYGSYPEKYLKYVLRKNTIGTGDFIFRSSGLVATSLGIESRGFIKEKYFADIVVFDSRNFRSNANYINPKKISEGIVFNIINGEIAIENRNLLTGLSGRPLHKDSAKRIRHCRG